MNHNGLRNRLQILAAIGEKQQRSNVKIQFENEDLEAQWSFDNNGNLAVSIINVSFYMRIWLDNEWNVHACTNSVSDTHHETQFNDEQLELLFEPNAIGDQLLSMIEYELGYNMC